MTGLEFMLVLGFLLMLVVFFAKVGNVMTNGSFYGVLLSWIGFFVYLLFFGLGFVLSMYDLSALSFVLLRFSSFLLVPLFAFHFFEVFYTIKNVSTSSLRGGDVASAMYRIR